MAHIRELQREVESAFAFVPDVDVYDVDDAFIVRVDLPGVRQEDLDVVTEDGLLVIKGTRVTEAPEGKAVYAERLGGQFVRTIEVPGRAERGQRQGDALPWGARNRRVQEHGGRRRKGHRRR